MNKRPLSRIVLNRILLSILISFVSIMLVSSVCIYIAGTKKQEKEIVTFLGSQKDYIEEWTDKDCINSLRTSLGYEGEEFLTSQDFIELIERGIDKDWLNEADIIDHNGIIIQSNIPEHIGYDLHSDSQSAEFLMELESIDPSSEESTKMHYDDGDRMYYTGCPIRNTDCYLRIRLDEALRRNDAIDYAISSACTTIIGETGFEMVLDKDGTILWSKDNVHDGEKLPLNIDIPKFAGGKKILNAKIYGGNYYVWIVSIHDFCYLLIALPLHDVWWSLNLALAALVIICALAFTMLYFILSRMLNRHVVSGVYSIRDSLRRITAGDLDEKADFRQSIEFDELSEGINVTVDRLKDLIKEASERIDAELALAAKIQTSFLPHKFPAFPNRSDFDLYARMIPAKSVGGDFYDYFLVDDDHLALVMADVSDKGIPSAMFMAMAMDKIRHSVAKFGTDVAAAITEVNIELLSENDSGLFVTVWLGVVTLSTGHIDYVDAGHEFPAICRSGNVFTIEEDVHNAPVAALKRMTFDPGTLELNPGDTIFLYTDGITEANNSDEEMFKAERMLKALNGCPDAPVDEIDNAVRSAIAEFVSDAPQFDDMTTLVFRYNGNIGNKGDN